MRIRKALAVTAAPVQAAHRPLGAVNAAFAVDVLSCAQNIRNANKIIALGEALA